MDPVFATMLDVVRIVTFQPTAPNIDAGRVAREREYRSTDAIPADESVPGTVHAAQRQSQHRRGWFKFSFMPR